MLELDPETMRQMGYHIIDLLVDYWQHLPQQPIGRRPSREELESLLMEPIPTTPQPFEQVLHEFQQKVLPHIVHVDHPRYFAFVPAPNNAIGVFADALAAGMNIFVGTWMVGAGATQVERVVIDWLRQLLGMPETAGGLFVSGGSVANLVALTAARQHQLRNDFSRGVAYFSDQTHSCIERALRILGFRPEQMRVLPSDDRFRLPLDALQAQLRADRAAGWQPFCIIANAGTTNTGAVDPLPELVAICRREGLWLHVDGAYGAAMVLTDEGKHLLQGIGEVDSLAIDPHKGFYQPMAAGCVLVREFEHLREAFRILPPYLQDKEYGLSGIDLCDYGVELSRGFRALKLWMSLKVFGIEAFRHALEHNLHLARYAEQRLRERANWQIVSPATLGIVAFRYAPPHLSEEKTDALNQCLVDAMLADGFALVSSTRLRGRVALRMCPLNPRATEADVDETIHRLDRFAQARLQG
ncbi:L-2,4-diaminobutyrate decarboxylase [bacterium HR15]|nr:L-2,4-diaminobutyrate decarboxylase [bacterium HR15]